MSTWEKAHCPGRHDARSQLPHVTKVEFSVLRLCLSYHLIKESMVGTQVSQSSTMSWVIPVSSVQKMSALERQLAEKLKWYYSNAMIICMYLNITLTYWWNVSIIWKFWASTIMHGNSMISWGCILFPCSHCASKSKARKYLKFCLELKKINIAYHRIMCFKCPIIELNIIG